MTNKEFDTVHEKISNVLKELEKEGIKKHNILRYIMMKYENIADEQFNVTPEMYIRLFRVLTNNT